MSNTHDVDVLVVGAGPTGTTLALELAQQKVSFRIVDKEPVRSIHSRAFALQPRSQELLNRHGAAQDLLHRGMVARKGTVFVNKKPAATLVLGDLAGPDTEFPLPLMVSQAETEHYLDSCLQTYGRSVERPIAVSSIAQDADGVTVTLTRQDGGATPDETVRCKYVVGCDGAHSVVRHATKAMTFDGAPYPQEFILCDAKLSDSNLEEHRVHLAFGERFLAIFRLDDGTTIRLVTTRLMSGNARDDDPQPTLADFQKIWGDMMPEGSGQLHDASWVTRFRLHSRGVNTYRDRRLFVAGDAAHIHSPIGGQGMNTGIQDAINLGWKLGAALRRSEDGTAVLRAERAEALLDSYHVERWPVGQSLLRGTDRLFSWVAAPGTVLRWLRNTLVPWVFPFIVSRRSLRKAAFDFVSEFGITYRGSAIVGTAKGFTGPVKGGDRLPDGKLRRLGADTSAGGEAGDTWLQSLCRGGTHHLLLLAGTGDTNKAGDEALQLVSEKVLGSKGATDSPQVHIIYGGDASGKGNGLWDIDGAVHSRLGFAGGPGYVYMRPDGYVAHIGLLSSVDELVSFLDA